MTDIAPELIQRIRAAWFDIEVSSMDLKARFRLSSRRMVDLTASLGRRPSYGISPKRGTSPRNRLTNGWAR